MRQAERDSISKFQKASILLRQFSRKLLIGGRVFAPALAGSVTMRRWGGREGGRGLAGGGGREEESWKAIFIDMLETSSLEQLTCRSCNYPHMRMWAYIKSLRLRSLAPYAHGVSFIYTAISYECGKLSLNYGRTRHSSVMLFITFQIHNWNESVEPWR